MPSIAFAPWAPEGFFRGEAAIAERRSQLRYKKKSSGAQGIAFAD